MAGISTISDSRSPVRPPFRADVVGSFLRPLRLKEARERLLGPQTPDQHLGPHDNAALRVVEDDCVRDVIAIQERAGLQAATDGEFRRRSWWLDLIMGWEGFSGRGEGLSATGKDTTGMVWRREDGSTKPFSRLWVVGPIRWRPGATVRAFEFLNANTRLVPKVTLPSPIFIHMFSCGDRGILDGYYRDPESFWTDLIAAYRQEVEALVAAGATYIQFDDTSIAFLCDPAHRARVERWGTGPDDLLPTYASRMNELLAHIPDHVTVTMHQCRGNYEGHWAAEGGLDPVADVLFNQFNAHGYFLEFDTPRAGGFAPLRLLPKGKVAAIGIMSSKTAVLEDKDALKRRVEEAAKFVSVDQLAISPQCGFASSIGGNPLTERQQEEKLFRLVEVARAIW
jgi:5-methyltetrahydropteroyltriglutamate--homocysteine methyltransferase